MNAKYFFVITSPFNYLVCKKIMTQAKGSY